MAPEMCWIGMDDGWPGQTTGDWRENLEETSELKASWWQGIRKTREV